MTEKKGVAVLIKRAIVAVICFLLLVLAVVFIFEGSKNNAAYVVRSLGIDNLASADTAKSMMYGISFFGVLPVGKAELVNNGIIDYKGQQVYYLSGQADTAGIISSVFQAHAEAHSYIDKDKLYPVLFKQTLILPDKPKDEKEISYDQDNLMMEIKGVRRLILANTQDPLSIMFYLSRQRFETGKEFDININTNQRNYRFFLKVLRKEEVTIKGKSTGIWVVKGDIRRRDKSPRHTSMMTLWLLDNPAKTPLLTKVSSSGIFITARLVGMK